MAAVRCTGFLGSSLGKLQFLSLWSLDSYLQFYLFTFPRCLEARFRGRKASDPAKSKSMCELLDLIAEADHVEALQIFGETCTKRGELPSLILYVSLLTSLENIRGLKFVAGTM